MHASGDLSERRAHRRYSLPLVVGGVGGGRPDRRHPALVHHPRPCPRRRHLHSGPGGDQADRSVPLRRRGGAPNTNRDRPPNPVGRFSGPSRLQAGHRRDRCHRAGRRSRGHRRFEGARDLRARVRRLDARLRGRRVKRSGDGEHRGDRGRAADPDDDHVESARVDHRTGAAGSCRRDARLDEGSRRERRRAIAPSAHVDRLRARRGPRTPDGAELGRTR